MLNERQKEGVLTVDGPLLVIAGAGSGKTKMLTSRIVHLIQEHGVRPNQILAVTFTNKAAGEMRERVCKALGMEEGAWDNRGLNPPFWMENKVTELPTIGTFHSVCIRILRREIQYLPFTAQFQVLDDSDQLSLVKECFEKLNLNEKMFAPKTFQYAINDAKCAAREPADVPVSEYDVFSRNFQRIYEMYQQELFKSNGLDFGEIITLTYKLFKNNPDVLKKYQDMYRYLHVDEYQDTNRAQYLVIQQLASAHRNLCVVGDEDQSIYKWRGADIRNILDFEKDYPEARIVKLEQNYRSTQTIISASSALIANNTTRKAKTLWTANEVGEKIRHVQLSDDHKEAEFVVKTIKELGEEDYAFSDVAIFYRTNAQSRIFEDFLRRERIPYNIIGALKFYDRKEIKDIVAYMRLLANENDSLGLKRIINVPARGIGKTTVERIEQIQFSRSITFLEAIQVAITEGVITGAAAKKVSEFMRLLADLKDAMTSMNLGDFYHHLLDRTGYVQELRVEGTEEAQGRIENLQELDSIIADFQSLQREYVGAEGELVAESQLGPFLENITLASETNVAEDSTTGHVSLMTLHTSKGLEFPVVFMVGMEDGLFPSVRGNEEDPEAELEEERRLCYVGMTRAKQLLFMSNAVSRRIYGQIVYQEPSRFFEEIPKEYIEFTDYCRFKPSINDREYEYDDVPSYSYNTGGSGAKGLGATKAHVGKRVRHNIYGMGIIRTQEGSDSDPKVTVEFQGNVTKKFMLKFAQLEFMN